MQNSLGGQKSPDQFPCAGFYQNSRQMIAHILRKSHLNNPTVPFGPVPFLVRFWFVSGSQKAFIAVLAADRE